MSVTPTVATVPQPPARHSSSCAGGCGMWIAANSPSCLPYPCMCAQTKANAPEWGRDRCWWVVKATGRTTSRCPCWGRERDGRPGGCCAHHSANPRYAAPIIEPVPLIEFEMPAAPAGWHAPHERADWEPDEDVTDRPARVDAGLLDWSHLNVPTHDPEIEYPVYVRRWTHAELHCDCPEPATWPKTSVTVHCTNCHTHWANPGTFAQHRRLWWEPCRAPADIRDVDTGRPLLRQGADGIWSAAYPTAE